MRRALYAGRLDLLDHREAIGELLALEQRTLPSGRPRIAAPAGQHDDFATALLALVHDLGGDAAPAAGVTIPPVPFGMRDPMERRAAYGFPFAPDGTPIRLRDAFRRHY